MKKTFKQRHQAFLKLVLFVMLSSFTACNLPSGQTGITTQTGVFPQQTLAASLFPPTATATQPVEIVSEPTPIESPTAENPTQEPSLTQEPSPTQPIIPEGYIKYFSQSGDTLTVVAAHFGAQVDDILTFAALPAGSLLPVGSVLAVPYVLKIDAPYPEPALPDSEVVYGPGSIDFDPIMFAAQAGGFLPRYTEEVYGDIYTGPEIVQMVALESSSNPRLLLAFLEFRSNWVFGEPIGAEEDEYPIGFGASLSKGLYKELMISARMLAQGYYGWRDGTLHELSFYDGSSAAISSDLNAGTVAIQALFASLFGQDLWKDALYGENGFLVYYLQNFGDPWARAEVLEPLLNADVRQPELALPFLPGLRWSLTGGPHIAWQTGTPRGALDFAPVTGESVCQVSVAWATAAAPGLVVRSASGVVALDLDGDGDEGTGWVLIYLHIAEADRAQVGAWLDLDGLIGHPSCERGQSSGTHVHFVRKYNGEWIAAEGALPLILDGWRAFAGEGRYEGFLSKGEQIVTASPVGMQGSSIFRE
ncbi:MAG: hypothetical protein ABIG43_06085 [Chloroflexota bacterium]